MVLLPLQIRTVFGLLKSENIYYMDRVIVHGLGLLALILLQVFLADISRRIGIQCVDERAKLQ